VSGKTGAEVLRGAVRAFGHCRESFLDHYSAVELLALYDAWQRSEWGILPDEWEGRQVEEAIEGRAPCWEEYEDETQGRVLRAVYSTEPAPREPLTAEDWDEVRRACSVAQAYVAADACYMICDSLHQLCGDAPGGLAVETTAEPNTVTAVRERMTDGVDSVRSLQWLGVLRVWAIEQGERAKKAEAAHVVG
jgi:hypothetical protein